MYNFKTADIILPHESNTAASSSDSSSSASVAFSGRFYHEIAHPITSSSSADASAHPSSDAPMVLLRMQLHLRSYVIIYM